MSRIFQLPRQVPLVSGAVSPGAKANFFLTGTTTPTDTYTDAALTTPSTNPVIANAAGEFATIYLDPDVIYKLTLDDTNDALIYTEDPIQDALTQENIGLIFYPRSAAEISAGVTPVNFFEIYGNILRYGTNTTPGTTDMEGAKNNGLSVLTSGGSFYIPGGRYLFKRGTGILIADNIVAGDIRIYGDGAATILEGEPLAGGVPNNVGNQFYNFFQATNKNNITIENLHFKGYLSLFYGDSCTNVLINKVSCDGLLANAGGFMRDKAVYFTECSDVRVTNSKFLNNQFGVYLFGVSGTRTKNAIVTACHFENDVAAGSFTTLFPVGVYVVFADETIVSANTFKNIYSSLDSGTTGTGMGYGVYEGDGECNSLIVANNQFVFEGNGDKNAHPWYCNESKVLKIHDNIVKTAGIGCQLAMKSGSQRYSVHDNEIETGAAVVTQALLVNVSSANCVLDIADNDTKFSRIQVACSSTGLELTIDGNDVLDTFSGPGVQVNGTTAANTVVKPKVRRNTVTKPDTNGILFGGYVVQAKVLGNDLIDCDQTGGGTEANACLRFATFSFGSFIDGNSFIKNPGGGGSAVKGISNASSATGRIFKDIIGVNSFEGFANNTQFHRFVTASPTNGIYDVDDAESIKNTDINASSVPAWQCVFSSNPSLDVNASNGGGTQITVSSTSSVAAGDIILLVKNTTAGVHADTDDWHVTTVASVDSGTLLTLTDAIPAGDGTYVAGTAFVKIARFKAHAAIAA